MTSGGGGEEKRGKKKKTNNNNINKQNKTHIYRHLSYYKVDAFFKAFERYNLTPDNHIDYKAICKVYEKLLWNRKIT